MQMQFPGEPISVNHMGVPENFDLRLRPWYLNAATAAKDIVIIVDCSYSRRVNGRFHRAKAAIRMLLKTLSKSDYVNIICACFLYLSNCGAYYSQTSDSDPA